MRASLSSSLSVGVRRKLLFRIARMISFLSRRTPGISEASRLGRWYFTIFTSGPACCWTFVHFFSVIELTSVLGARFGHK